ncbi:MAG TPA: methylmalonyl-CoA mutase family protein [Chryseosolibacter sp.]
MPENSIHSTLRETFSLSNKENWKRFASQELDGKNPDEILSWNSEDQLIFFAYYDASDEEKNFLSPKFQLAVAGDPYFGPAKWLNIPCVTVTSEKSANQTALQHLTNGADGILFKINGKVNLDNLLAGVEWRYCSLFFQSADPENLIADVSLYTINHKLSSQEISGGFIWDSTPDFNNRILFRTGLKNILSVAPSTSVNEIAAALSHGVTFFEQSQAQSEEFFKSIAFSMPVGTLFLESIARLKALRFLWYQVAQAYGYSSYQISDLHIHVRSDKWIDEQFQPHGNMLKSTIASMASVIGGANAITIEAEDESNTMMTRIARNVSTLLREESNLDKVSDPTAGAFAIEVMTKEFAKHAWKSFQDKQKK